MVTEERPPGAKYIYESTNYASTQKQRTWESEARTRAIDH